MDPPDRPPQQGVRIVLDRAEANGSVVYRGRLEFPERSVPIEVRIDGGATSDGLSASAEAPGLPQALRPALERLAAAMARSAVRTARRLGTPPPRRIQRWRRVS